jgi:ribose 1,5-bisphosphokinase
MIGPGKLVLVVGPSGAGKDTLMTIARANCLDDANIVFPRRAVTRVPSSAEDHDTLSDQAFEAAVAAGAFAFWWAAHGLKYGIPAGIDGDIRLGKTVVCNVSRTIVGSVRGRYARCVVILVTAPREILAARLAARERASDGEISQRIQRTTVADAELDPDLTIENIELPQQGGQKLSVILRMSA